MKGLNSVADTFDLVVDMSFDMSIMRMPHETNRAAASASSGEPTSSSWRSSVIGIDATRRQSGCECRDRQARRATSMVDDADRVDRHGGSNHATATRRSQRARLQFRGTDWSVPSAALPNCLHGKPVLRSLAGG